MDGNAATCEAWVGGLCGEGRGEVREEGRGEGREEGREALSAL